MKVAITAESTIDLPEELKIKFNIKTVPFTVLVGETAYKDGEIECQEIFDYVTKTGVLPKTSAVNQFQYEEFFSNIFQEKYDAIVHFSLSKEISCAYENACEVAKKMKNVFVVNSATLSTGIALLAIEASNMANAGLSGEEIYEKCQSLVPKVQASFVINKLKYLHKGGRCSTLALLGANLLKIKPYIIVENGKMRVFKKYIGSWENCLKKYKDDLQKIYPNPNKENVFITYTTAPREIVESLHNSLKEQGFKNIYETTAGCTITSHCGENTLGILFLNN